MIVPNKIRQDFPIFKKHPNLVYLDSAATALKPQVMLDKLNEYYTQYSSNIHRGIYGLSEKATDEYEQARATLAKFIGAQTDEVIFTSGTTGGVNLLAYSLGEQITFSIESEIVVLESEHHSNFVPWQRLAQQKGCKFVVTQNILESISPNTKIVALAGVSNVLGQNSSFKFQVSSLKQKFPEIIIVIDGAQMAAHEPVDVKNFDCDFFVFSGHKMGGPTGIGVLWGKKKLLDVLPPYQVGGGMISKVTNSQTLFAEAPAKFEAGTPPIAEAIALGAAVKYLMDIGMDEIKNYELEIGSYAIKKLNEELGKDIEFLDLMVAKESSSIISFNLVGCHPHDVAQILADDEICIRAGHHCAQPLHDSLGIVASCRASFWVYNTKGDVDRLVVGLKQAKKILS